MLSNLSGAMNGRAIIRQTRAIRRLCHSLPATGEGCGRSEISRSPQRDGFGVAKTGGGRGRIQRHERPGLTIAKPSRASEAIVRPVEIGLRARAK